MYVRAVCVHGVNVNGKIGILRRGISRKSRGAVNAIYSRLAYSSLEKYLKRVSPLVILARRNGNPLEGVFFFFFYAQNTGNILTRRSLCTETRVDRNPGGVVRNSVAEE